MSRNRLNHRLAKIHRSYTVSDIVARFGVHPNTVRGWMRAGLPTTDRKRPVLIRGADLRAFLESRRRANKRPCLPGELYCVRCRSPKTPADGLVEYKPLSANTGQLIGICATCEHLIHRMASLAKLAQVLGKLELLTPRAL